MVEKRKKKRRGKREGRREDRRRWEENRSWREADYETKQKIETITEKKPDILTRRANIHT